MATSSVNVFITSEKSPNTLSKIRPALVQTSTSLSYSSQSNKEEFANKGKKRRLDHLTWEEKIQRKKLKNRVAAQTSRDRKKARIEDMEAEIKNLSQTMHILQNKCKSLQTLNDLLLEKNQTLDIELKLLQNRLSSVDNSENQTISTSSNNSVNTHVDWITPNGSTICKGIAEEKSNDICLVEDYCSLPVIQDLLDELHEDLLVDHSGENNASSEKSDLPTNQTKNMYRCITEPMVGSPAKCLESIISKCIPKIEQLSDNIKKSSTNSPVSGDNISTVELHNMKLLSKSISIECLSSKNIHSSDLQKSVFGTYDVETNSITIVADDIEVPLKECNDEIYSESDDDLMQGFDYLEYTSPYLSHHNTNDSIHKKPILYREMCDFIYPKENSDCYSKNSLTLNSALSDHGYGSITGSPHHANSEQYEQYEQYESQTDFSWNNSFVELFPNLI